jgi:peptide/nickel transport system substrate-binding protein
MSRIVNIATSASVAFLAGFLVSVANGPVSAQETPKRGGTLVYALTADPPHLNAALTNDLNAQQTATQVFSQLIRVNKNAEITGDLAESWSMAPDGLSYTFKIRKGVKWHDGKPLTADDVRWALTEITMKLNPNASTGFAAVSGIEAPDDTTLIVRMKQPFPAFLPWSLVNQWIYPRHIYEGTDPRQNERNFRNPVGSGPFKFKEWVRGSHIIFERNPDYYIKGEPYLDRLVARFIPDPGARVIALERGEVDFLNIYGLPSSAIPDLRKAKGIVVETHPKRVNFGAIMAHFNLRNPHLAKKEVRQALSYAVDRKLITERAFGGIGAPASGPISSYQKEYFEPKIDDRYAYNPAKAEELLQKAGIPKGPDGKRFSLRITYARAGEGGGLQAAAEIMREEFRPLGIDLVLEPKDYSVWMESAHLKWDFDLSMGSYQTGPDPAVAVARLYITKNIQKLMGRNLMGYSNPKVDELFDAGEREIDHSKRVKIYQQIQDIMVEDAPALFLWDRLAVLAFRDRAKGDLYGGAHMENFANVWVTDGK